MRGQASSDLLTGISRQLACQRIIRQMGPDSLSSVTSQWSHWGTRAPGGARTPHASARCSDPDADLCAWRWLAPRGRAGHRMGVDVAQRTFVMLPEGRSRSHRHRHHVPVSR